MKKTILQICAVALLIGLSVAYFKMAQSKNTWIVAYDAGNGELTVLASSENNFYRHSSSAPSIEKSMSGIWSISDEAPEDIKVLFIDKTIAPGRVDFEIAGNRFDLSTNGLILERESERQLYQLRNAAAVIDSPLGSHLTNGNVPGTSITGPSTLPGHAFPLEDVASLGFSASGRLGVVQSVASILGQGISLFDTYQQVKGFLSDEE